MKIRELYSDPSKWTKHVFALDSKRNPLTDPLNPAAVAWCLGGAVNKCYSETERAAVRQRISDRVRPGGNGSCVHLWNDTPERTFEQVKGLVDELDI